MSRKDGDNQEDKRTKKRKGMRFEKKQETLGRTETEKKLTCSGGFADFKFKKSLTDVRVLEFERNLCFA